jgi:hypothetical protein
MRHGVGVPAGVMIALCVASLPSGTTCPHLQHPGAVSVRARGAGEDGLLGVANMVVSDREEERSCSVGIGRRRHWRLVLRGGRRKGKLEAGGQGEADAGAAPIQPTALERFARSSPPPSLILCSLPTSCAHLFFSILPCCDPPTKSFLPHFFHSRPQPQRRLLHTHNKKIHLP